MNTAIVSSIIGTVGAGFIAVLVFYLQGLRDDIRALGARIDVMGSSLRSEFGERIDGESGLRSELGGRIDKVESGLKADLGGRIDKVESGLKADLGGRIDKVESGLKADLGGRIEKVESGLKADLGGRIDKVESRLTAIDGKLARIETTQEEHGRKLDGIADHGERISALEGASAAMS